tara:strand:+ start:602 stop:1165 length:564 start_codon:yes stop_codon:yes gene_type:complete
LIPLFLSVALCLASPHQSVISNTSITYVKESYIYPADSISILVKYHGYDEEEALQTFRILQRASTAARVYLVSEKMSVSECKQLAIDIYDLKYEDINNRGITAFFNWDDKSFDRVFALYDSILSPPGRSSIFITASEKFDRNGLSEEKRKEVLSHEIMHYWQDRTCNTSHDIESQAVRFGRYIRDKI